MKPINIYALTRVENLSLISRLERQMSARKRFLHVKQWEMKSLKAFTDHVTDCIDDAVSFHFYYSFQIPRPSYRPTMPSLSRLTSPVQAI